MGQGRIKKEVKSNIADNVPQGVLSCYKQGLDEAGEYYKGKKGKVAIVHEFTPVDVKNIRAKVGMSQIVFASAFDLSASTLRH